MIWILRILTCLGFALAGYLIGYRDGKERSNDNKIGPGASN